MHTRHSRHRTRPVALSGLMALLLVLFTLVPSAVPAEAASSLRLNRANVAAGDTLTVSGFGFHAGDTTVVSLDYAYGNSNRRLQTAVTVAANGVFSATLTIPNSITPNDYTVSARDFHGATASTSLRVLPLILLQAGQKSSGAVTVTAGQAFYVRGHGFGAGHQVTLKVTFPRYGASTVTLAHTVTSASDGSFGDVYFQTPVDSTIGTAALSATSSAGKTAQAYVRIAYHPHISLSASTIIPGASFTVNGSGFVPNSRVTVSVSLPRNGAATETIAQQVTANGSGSFSTTLATPSNVRTGSSTVTALDSTAGLTTSTSLTVSVHPTIALSQSEAVPGTIITVTGGGFTVSADVILTAHFALYGGGSKTVTVVTRSGSARNITTQLQVPLRAAPGTVSVLAKGPNGQASTALHVRAIASSIVVTSSVIPGSALSIRGTGFEPNRTIDIHTTVKLLSGTTKLLSKSVTTNSSGTFTTTLGIPSNVLGGSYSISATTTATGLIRTARFTVAALRPSIVLVPTMVNPGAAVTVNGFGFGAGESVTLS
ncbi:MAG: hypothetical protein M3Z66_21695, partial [Chloroflexota bacterium]|nr:hypothetical protein [Chloroflexota bacterium]